MKSPEPKRRNEGPIWSAVYWVKDEWTATTYVELICLLLVILGVNSFFNETWIVGGFGSRVVEFLFGEAAAKQHAHQMLIYMKSKPMSLPGQILAAVACWMYFRVVQRFWDSDAKKPVITADPAPNKVSF